MNSRFPLLTLSVAVIGLLSAWLPAPFGFLSVVMIFTGMISLIVLGHVASFQADKSGLVAFWARPLKMSSTGINSQNKRLMLLALTMSVSAMLSIATLLVLTS